MSQRIPASLLVCFLLLSLLPAAAQRATVINEDHHDASQPLRNMVKTAPVMQKADIPGEFSEFEAFEKPLKNPSYPDTAVQTSASVPVNTVSGLNIAGLGQGDYGYSVTFPVPD